MSKKLSITSFIVSLGFLALGLYKMFVYSNPESFILSSKNAYVGGDAYNYIINANYATSFFVLAIGFTILGGLFLINHTVSKYSRLLLIKISRETKNKS
ncbi:MAG: hypothetical protein AB1Z19_09610 [Eubacteriales bacterium]